MHILSLLPELTVVIFSHLVRVDPPQASHTGMRLGWINVTHVCRNWREVALDYPLLWTELSGELGPRWLDAFFQRSQECLVTLNKFDYYHNRVRLLDKLLPPTLHRIQNLTIEQTPSRYVRALLTSRPAPELREFHFICRHAETEPFIAYLEMDTSTSTLPELFAGDAPRLQKLTLHHVCFFPWNSSAIAGLTSLRLTYVKLSAWETREIISSLQRMWRLEEFYLHCYAHAVTGLPPSITNVVELEKLKCLSIEADHTLFHYVYRHIRHPRATRLLLTSSMQDQTHSGDHGVDGILALLLSHPSHRSMEDYKTIGLNPGSGSRSSLRIQCWEEEFPLTTQNLPDPPFVLTMADRSTAPDAPFGDVRKQILSALRFPNARTLYLHARNGLLNVELTTATAHLPSVSILSITCGRDENPEDARMTLLPLGQVPTHTRPLLPNLQTLAFPLEHYGLMSAVGDKYDMKTTGNSMLEDLRRFVVNRQRLGVPLRALYLHPSTLRASPSSDPSSVPSELADIMPIHERSQRAGDVGPQSSHRHIDYRLVMRWIVERCDILPLRGTR
ncbi:unnamed protein product [Peniophora sp. CBMAI 1063]|nr:unnamed protein product [Peniophora sp. CBMAI 1063]